MKVVRFICCLFLAGASAQVLAWGQNGHRIVGQIASDHLTDTTRAALQPLLAGDLLPEVATWADEMRSAPGDFWQKKSAPWHYINFTHASDFHPDEFHAPHKKEDVKNLYSALLQCVAVLRSRDATLEERQFYFRFLVHLVGDLHQPLHTGHEEDRGGNAIEVTFFGDKTNLHSLWDTGLIESQQLSFSEFAAFIETDEPPQLQAYLMSGPADWLKESLALSDEVYAGVADPSQRQLSYTYVYNELPIVKQRLLQAGIRLAGLLNSIFDSAARVGSQAIPRNAIKTDE